MSFSSSSRNQKGGRHATSNSEKRYNLILKFSIFQLYPSMQSITNLTAPPFTERYANLINGARHLSPDVQGTTEKTMTEKK